MAEDNVLHRLMELLADEESEVKEYVDLSLKARDIRVRMALKTIAEDTIVHYYVVKALIEALREINVFRKRFNTTEGELSNEEIAKILLGHDKLESLVSASYLDVIDKIDVGSVKAIIKAIASEENKHEKLVELILKISGFKLRKKK